MRARTLIIILILFGWVGIFCRQATALDPQIQNLSTNFSEQARATVGEALRGHDGLVMVLERPQQRKLTFGNKALSEEKFRPGSLMKLVTAEAALKNDEMPAYRCSGHDKIGGKRFTCWTYKGHGWVDLAKALSLSCNLYFAKLGTQLGVKALMEALSAYSFSESPMLSEKKLTLEQLARLAIGDSPLFHVTPAEMLVFWDLFLNHVESPDYAVIEQGLRRAVREGTGQRAAASSFEILGKTGTSDAEKSAYKTDGWFLGAYPAGHPRYAVLVFLRHAHGFEEAATLAGKIFSLGFQTGFFEIKN